MKPVLFCFTLLASSLVPCAAQTGHAPIQAHSSRRPSVTQVTRLYQATAPKTPAVRPVSGGPFSDVPKDHWAAAAVETLRQRGIVVGYPPSK